MKNYLSFGGGVNSVALHLMLLDQKVEFESVFVDHGTDWPETYEYLKMFQKWLKKNGHDQITVLNTGYQGEKNLYDYSYVHKMVPSQMVRWCSNRFKVQVVNKYLEKPCFQMIGFDVGEAHRASINIEEGIENRYPLIEAEINRAGCKKIIKDHGLPVPIKSGCFICPYQRVGQWKELRRTHPDLFCKAEKLEKRNMEYRKTKGKKPMFLNSYPRAPLRKVVDENQKQIFEQDEYPPCQCGL